MGRLPRYFIEGTYFAKALTSQHSTMLIYNCCPRGCNYYNYRFFIPSIRFSRLRWVGWTRKRSFCFIPSLFYIEVSVYMLFSSFASHYLSFLGALCCDRWRLRSSSTPSFAPHLSPALSYSLIYFLAVKNEFRYPHVKYYIPLKNK